MYCPKCNMNVYTKKNEFNIGLAIILAIFTGGIGLLIYVAVYLDKEHKPRCIHCDSVCYEQKEEITQPVSNYQVISVANNPATMQVIEKSEKKEERSHFCYNCGTELNRSDNAKFCALCGSSI